MIVSGVTAGFAGSPIDREDDGQLADQKNKEYAHGHLGEEMIRKKREEAPLVVPGFSLRGVDELADAVDADEKNMRRQQGEGDRGYDEQHGQALQQAADRVADQFAFTRSRK